MGNLTGFQLTIIILFAFAAILGVTVFATGFGISGPQQISEVIIWGDIEQRSMDSVISELKSEDERFSKIVYFEKDSRTYQSEIINALASGSGPDLFMLGQDEILEFKDKTL